MGGSKDTFKKGRGKGISPVPFGGSLGGAISGGASASPTSDFSTSPFASAVENANLPKQENQGIASTTTPYERGEVVDPIIPKDEERFMVDRYLEVNRDRNRSRAEKITEMKEDSRRRTAEKNEREFRGWRGNRGRGNRPSPPTAPDLPSPGRPNPMPEGFTHSGGYSTMALVSWYNPETGETWTAPNGGFRPPEGSAWVQGRGPSSDTSDAPKVGYSESRPPRGVDSSRFRAFLNRLKELRGRK